MSHQYFGLIVALERTINGSSSEKRIAVRQEAIAPLVDDLFGWMRAKRGKLSRPDNLLASASCGER